MRAWSRQDNSLQTPTYTLIMHKLDPAHTHFFLCDVQTRFSSVVYGFDEVVLTCNKMLKLAKVLGIPVIATEQNSRVFGPTAPGIDLAALADMHVATIEKSLFSMMVPEVKALLGERPHITSVVLFGIEVSYPSQAVAYAYVSQSHICVLQTALDLIQGGYDVYVLADGVSSSNKEEVPIALAHIRQVGGHVITSESAAFMLQREAGTPQFKAFAAVIKDEKDNTVKTSQKLLQYRSWL
ncbi:Isochorismatase-like protein [Boletus edulis]|nr:Isochorismatase-like protein [Boletus edulis]